MIHQHLSRVRLLSTVLAFAETVSGALLLDMSHRLTSLQGDYIGDYSKGHKGGYQKFRLWLI